MASRRLRKRASAIARAQNAPARRATRSQIGATRRDTHAVVQSLASEGNALQAAVDQARADLMHTPGLTGRDQRLALESMAGDRADIAGGIAAQQGLAHQAGADAISGLRSQIVDIGTQQGADQAAALSDLLAQRQANQHDVAMAHLTSRLSLKNALAETAAQASGQGGPLAGLTPLQQREIHGSRDNALSVVRQAIGLSGQGKGPPMPTNDAEWQTWGDALYNDPNSPLPSSVSRSDVQWAINHYRQSQMPQDPLAAVAGATPMPFLSQLALLLGRSAAGGLTGLAQQTQRTPFERHHYGFSPSDYYPATPPGR